MNEKMNFLKRLKISITSIKGYKELIKEKLSKAILYSIIFSLIIGVIQGVFSFITISAIQKTMEKVISSDEFKFTFQDGILNFENSPIKSEEGGEMIVYIDTDISLDEKDTIRNIVVHKDMSISILKDGISCRINGEETEFKFSDVPLVGEINNAMLLKSMNIIGLAKYVAFVNSIIMTYIMFMINVLILSLLGLILNAINRLELTYEKIFKISIYANTTGTIIGIIVQIGSLGFLISGVYLLLITNYLKSEKNINNIL